MVRHSDITNRQSERNNLMPVPEKIPTFEELRNAIGDEKMEFMTEMARPTYKKGQAPQELEDFEKENQ